MRMFRSPLLAFLSLVLGTSLAWAKDLPEYNEEGMKLVEDSRHSTVYADEDADLSIYTQVWLEPATVAFQKHWKRTQNRYNAGKVRDSDMEKIKVDLAELFHEEFGKKLEQGGYSLADGPGETVLKVEPHIVDLNITAPDIPQANRVDSFSESAGEMTLELVLYDSVTGDKIAKARNRKQDYRRGYMEWRTRVQNRATAVRMIGQWADLLLEALDEARETVGN